jgi:hypothetical protein
VASVSGGVHRDVSGITSASTALRVFASNFVTGFGIVLFFMAMLINEQTGVRGPGITDPTHLAEAPD